VRFIFCNEKYKAAVELICSPVAGSRNVDKKKVENVKIGHL
jgi:hypothetical protein